VYDLQALENTEKLKHMHGYMSETEVTAALQNVIFRTLSFLVKFPLF
jgi:hypothetical protein